MPKGIYKRSPEQLQKLRELGLSNKGKAYPRTKEWVDKLSESQSGHKDHQWKGDDVGYKGLHDWIFKTFGRPTQCELCLKDGLKGRQIHWANLSGKYKRDRSDWKRMCAKCHTAYDKEHNLRGHHKSKN